MECSPARLEANRRNAAKSTGPRTAEGKERSRGNAYKHGLAGAGIALTADDEAEVMALHRSIEAEFRPETDVERSLVRRLALLTIRLDRCAVRDSAAASDRVLSAEDDFDEDRLAEVDRLMDRLGDDPAATVRQLARTPEGIDRMVASWRALKADLTFKGENRWGPRHRPMAEHLSGRRPGDIGLSRVEALARAIRGDFTLLDPTEGGDLEDLERMAWSRDRMADLIDAEVARLGAIRERIDLDLIAARRALAPRIALFDPSKPGYLARRYEAEAERGFFRALKELRERRKATAAPARAAEPAASPVALATADLLGSFRAAEASGYLDQVARPATRPEPSPSRPATPPRPVPAPSRGPRDASTVVVGRG